MISFISSLRDLKASNTWVYELPVFLYAYEYVRYLFQSLISQIFVQLAFILI